jgi:hypothetical protein
LLKRGGGHFNAVLGRNFGREKRVTVTEKRAGARESFVAKIGARSSAHSGHRTSGLSDPASQKLKRILAGGIAATFLWRMIPDRGDGSKSLDKSVVVGVRTDEIPKGGISSSDTDSPPIETDPRRENRLGRMDLLKLETRVPRVSHPNSVGLESLLPDVRRKVGKQLSEPFSGS